MGGGFGQNGSVAWLVKGNKGNGHTHTDQGNGRGGKIEDPINSFKVRLRFRDPNDADAAWAAKQHLAAWDKFDSNGKQLSYVVVLRVPAQPSDLNRTYGKVDGNDEPNVNPPWEVLVDWDEEEAPSSTAPSGTSRKAATQSTTKAATSKAPSGASRKATTQSNAKKAASASRGKSKRPTQKSKSKRKA